MWFQYKQIHPEPTSPPPSLLGSSIPGHYSLAIIVPGPSTRHLGTVPMTQSRLKLLKLANPQPAYPALTISSHRNQNKAQLHSLFLSVCLLTDPVVPRRVACPLPLETLINKLSFQWKSSPHLLALPCLKFSSNTLYFRTHTLLLAFHPQSFCRYVHKANNSNLFGIHSYISTQLS